ncbi:hypothetical protein MJD09_24970 [bacterium]|nr:hypothetical protein [bacterium]
MESYDDGDMTKPARLLRRMQLLLVALFCITDTPVSSQVPNDIKWVTSSIEYAAACVQTYRNAWMAVREAAASEQANWVVVLDVDETVLDNSQYQRARAAVDSGYTPQSWAKWVLQEEATLVPGAKNFIDQVRTLGPKAHIAYITNRNFEHQTATVANLTKYDLFKHGDIMLTRKNSDDTKVKRRRCLETGTGRCKSAGRLRILALIGDNIRDFMPMTGREKAEDYRTQGVFRDPNWGRKYFMLPNPSYGSWQRDYH